MPSRIKHRLLACTGIATVVTFSPLQINAADLSASIEAGGTVNIDGADTFIVDSTNDGAADANIVYNDDATSGTDELTINSDGSDADDTGQINSITVLDNNGINSLYIEDATNGDLFRFNITGDIEGDIGSFANDLRIIIRSEAVNDDGDIEVAFGGNVDLGTGRITVHSDFDETDIATLIFNGTALQTITANIDAGSADDGSARNSTGYIVIGEGGSASNVTFDGVIGGNGTFENITINSGATATFKGNVSTSTLGGSDGLVSNGSMSIDTSENTVTVAEQTGHISINNGLSVTGSNNAFISSGRTVDFDGTLSTLLTGGRTLTIGGGTAGNWGGHGPVEIIAGNQIISSADLTIDDASSTLEIQKTGDFNPDTTDVIDAGGNLFNVANGLEVGISSESLDLGDGATVTVISGATAASDFDGKIVNGTITFRDTAFLDLKDDGSTNTELKFITVLSETPNGSTKQTAGALKNAVTATAGDAEARAAILALNENETNGAGLEMLADSTGGAATTQATAGNMVTGFDLVSSRLSNVRGGRSISGLSSGDEGNSKESLWVRAFGTTADQDERDGVQGYDADTGGLMIGGDALLRNGVRVGMNTSYSHTSVDTDGPGGHETRFDTYRLGVYGGKDLGHYYIEGQASLAYNDIDTSRSITFNGLDRQANGDTDGLEYGVRVGAGMPLALDGMQTFTPFANFQFVHADIDEYTEEDAGALNMRVDDTDIDIAELAIGGRYNTEIKYLSGTLKPEVRAVAAYDFIGDTSESTQTFTGGGATFTNEGADVEQFSVLYGAGLVWESEDEAMAFSLNYDGKTKSDYITHGVRLEAKFRF